MPARRSRIWQGTWLAHRFRLCHYADAEDECAAFPPQTPCSWLVEEQEDESEDQEDASHEHADQYGKGGAGFGARLAFFTFRIDIEAVLDAFLALHSRVTLGAPGP